MISLILYSSSYKKIPFVLYITFQLRVPRSGKVWWRMRVPSPESLRQFRAVHSNTPFRIDTPPHEFNNSLLDYTYAKLPNPLDKTVEARGKFATMVLHGVERRSRSAACSPYRKYQYARNDSTSDTGSWLTRERRVHTASHRRVVPRSNSIAHAFTRFRVPPRFQLPIPPLLSTPTLTVTPTNSQRNPSLTLQPPPSSFHPSNTRRFPAIATPLLPSTLLSLPQRWFHSLDGPTCGEQHRVLVYELVSSSTGKVLGRGREVAKQTKGEDEGKRSEKSGRGRGEASAGYAELDVC